MNTCVCVLSNSGERLMPTFRLGKVRRLLKDGKAKIVKHHPFTIQLLYDSKTNTQPIEICEDVGYNYIGISVKSESHEYVSAQYDTLKDEKEHHDDCRMHRRTRRCSRFAFCRREVFRHHQFFFRTDPSEHR